MDFTRKNCMVAYSKYVDKLINKIYITFKDLSGILKYSHHFPLEFTKM